MMRKTVKMLAVLAMLAFSYSSFGQTLYYYTRNNTLNVGTNNTNQSSAYAPYGKIEYNNSDNKYHINTVQDMLALSKYVNNGNNCSGKTFVLDNSLDFANAKDDQGNTITVTNFTPIGYLYGYVQNNKALINEQQSCPFSGTFDGGSSDVVIKNLQITTTTQATGNNSVTKDGTGLFGYVKDGELRNITIDNATVVANIKDNTSGWNSKGTNGYGIAAVAGYFSGNVILNCSVTNSIITAQASGNSNSIDVGAIVGDITKNNNTGEYTVGNITGCTASENTISGGTNVGGIVGDGGAKNIDQSCTSTNNTITATNTNGASGGVSGSDATITTPTSTGNTVNGVYQSNGSDFALYTGKWNFVGKIGNTFDVFNKNSLKNDIAAVQFDYQTNNWATGDDDYLYASDNMTAGDGYFIFVFNQDTNLNTVSTDGQITKITSGLSWTSGSVTINKTNSGAASQNSGSGGQSINGKWFALGNPFSTALKTSTVVGTSGNGTIYSLNGSTKSAIQGNVVYTYNATTGKWDNPTTIQPGQGFFVACATSANSIGGTLSAASKKLDTESKGNKTQDNNILFVSSANNVKKALYAAMDDNASNGFDIKDAYVMLSTANDNLVEPYFVVDDNEVLINKFKTLPYVCDINFHASKMSQTEFSVSNVPDDMEISLIDIASNQEIILDSNSFSFTAYAGENSGRYKIKFAKKNVSIESHPAKELNVVIMNDNKNVSVNGEDLTSVTVVSALGQTVYSEKVCGNSCKFVLNVPYGVYIVRANTQHGVKTEKIVIK